MSKKIFSTALFAILITFSVMAQKIAIVDVTAVLEGLPDYQKAQEQLDKVATQWRQEIAVEQDKIKGLYSKYQAEQVLLSEEMKKQREDEITAKEKEVRELQRQKFGPEGSLFKKLFLACRVYAFPEAPVFLAELLPLLFWFCPAF